MTRLVDKYHDGGRRRRTGRRKHRLVVALHPALKPAITALNPRTTPAKEQDND